MYLPRYSFLNHRRWCVAQHVSSCPQNVYSCKFFKFYSLILTNDF